MSSSELGASPFVTYVLTDKTFIKRDRAAHLRKFRQNGTAITRPWVAERLQNEATALKLIENETTVPVPKFIRSGFDADGLAFLETERLPGITLEKIKNQCRMDVGEQHGKDGLCEICDGLAKQNAQKFIEEEVLPQLEKLQSTTTGLNGFVLPPPWALEHDEREYWKPKTTACACYVFCHGDLAAHNIMINPETLEVAGIFDWEHAGYFPPEFQVWSVDRQDYWDNFRNTERIEELVALIHVD